MKVYHSRKSWILGFFLWGIIGFSYYSIGLDKFGLLDFLILSFVCFLWFGLKYVLDNKVLLVKIGPIIIYRIAIKEIVSVNRSFNPLSSPAASLKRIKIDFKKGSTLISPVREKEFISDLRKMNPSIYCGISWEQENESILTRFVYSIL